ncbi:hypothetical protein COO91_09063 [Nostoc flagelliforme CCNUN1]|uniref:Restriction endonuclease n=1 Tax=Nostoc flagelliforme CCNUN1 TaxID=2038116 RepID=A0A2K8T5D4_9NOSO|nr:hypothetical protein [Nostoc flagelliforme]AUB42912.1 hypothetical protein COO91_09063 [Nostoc flagelliforme CCNUN1]
MMKPRTTPTINWSGGTYDTSGERFLFNTHQHSTPFGYISRLKSVAAEDNPRWSGAGLTSLIRGREYEVMVAARLMAVGLNDVELTPNFNGDEKGDADIWVNKTHIIEVKSYDYHFTNADNFPYRNVFTNNVKSVLTKHQNALKRGGSLMFVVCSVPTGAMICGRYKPEVDTLTSQNNSGIETLVIPRERWHPLESMAEYIHQTNNPSTSYRLVEGSIPKRTTTTNTNNK